MPPENRATSQLIDRAADIEDHAQNEKLQQRHAVLGPDEGRQEGEHEDDDLRIEDVDQHAVRQAANAALAFSSCGSAASAMSAS